MRALGRDIEFERAMADDEGSEKTSKSDSFTFDIWRDSKIPI